MKTDLKKTRVSKSLGILIYFLLSFFPFYSVQSQAYQNPLSTNSLGKMRFNSVSIQEGLSQVTVLSIGQDKSGFLWFGTREGLNRYDGYEFRYFKHNPDELNPLTGNFVSAIYSDTKDNLWVGTDKGLNLFNLQTEKFINFITDNSEKDAISSKEILIIFEDKKGTLWVGTGNGLYRYLPTERNFEIFKYEFMESRQCRIETIYEDINGDLLLGTKNGLLIFDENKLVPYRPNNKPVLNKQVNAIIRKEPGQLWIGTSSGLYVLHQNIGEYEKFKIESPSQPGFNNVLTLYRDKRDNLWIGTESGLAIYNSLSNQVFSYQIDPYNPYSITDNYINTIFEDNSGSIWIGTDGGGLTHFDWSFHRFNGFGILGTSNNGLSDKFIYGICEDHENNIWLSTNNGLNRYNKKSGLFTYFQKKSNVPGSLSNNRVRSIKCDKNGRLWIGSYGGLNIYDPGTGKFKVYKHIPGDSASLSDDLVVCIYMESESRVWLGTKKGGLSIFNPLTETFKIIQHYSEEKGLHNIEEVRTIVPDEDGKVWIGTYGGGLTNYDPVTNQFVHFRNTPGDANSISSNFIYSIHKSSNGQIWIGTYGGGLNRYNKKEKNFQRYTSADGLPNDVIYGILEDEYGNLWLSTNMGLSRFNPNSLDEKARPTPQTFRNYDIDDGLQSNEFNFGAYYKSKSGEMYFGSINGLNFFHPQKIKDSPISPPIVITELIVLNKTMEVGSNSILTKSISETENLILTYEDYTFSLKFAALHYSNPRKNQYAYMLEDIDKDWVYIRDGSRIANYTTIEGGDYVFKVKAANSDGVWNEIPKEIMITIIPPLWEKGWFRFLAIFLIILLSGLYHNRRTYYLKKRQNELETMNNALNDQIRERAMVEDSLRNSEEKYRSLTNNLNVGIFRTTTDNDGQFVEINPALARMFGFSSKEDAQKVKVKDMYAKPKDRKQFIEKIWNKGFVNDEEVVLKRKDGQTLLASISAVSIRDMAGKPLYFDGLIEDVTEKKKVEQALIESEEKYRNFVERATDGILIIQEEIVKYANPKIAEMANLTADQVIGSKFLDFIHPDEREKVIARYKKRISGENVENIFETILVGQDGREIFAEINAGIINFAGGPADLIFVRDISERRSLEEQIRQVQKMEAIGMLAGGVAHDFNNILTIINGHAELALMKLGEKDPNFNLIKEIQKSGQRATDLTRQLLAFSRKQIIEPQILNVNGVIANMDKMLQRLIGEDINMKLILTPDLPKLKADPGQIEQVLMNLVINSRDAIHESLDKQKPKFITIETGETQIDSKKVGAFTNLPIGKYVIFYVTDTGNGIEKRILEKIFDPFFTTKGTGKGTGLGLSTVFGIIRQNKGTIEVQSKVGQGTTFKIYWPAADSESTETEYIDTRSKRELGSESILLVEDDEGVREFASIALQDAGYKVIDFEDGKKALNYIKNKKPTLDMLITDMIMPGMNGKELADSIKKIFPEIQVLYTSGYTDQHIVHDGSVKKGIHFTQKPYSAKNILTKIREILDN